jgi:hypothetical protein
MKIKTICLSAVAATVLAGAALAGALDEPAMMEPFFTDTTMKTMKPDPEMMKVWKGLSKSDQDSMVTLNITSLP